MTNEPQDDEQFYRDTESVAFAKLDDHQLALLEPLGQRRAVKRGDVVYKAGRRDGLTVVLRGEIQVVERRDDIEQELAVAHERDFIGDVARDIDARDCTSDIGRCRDSLYAHG